MDVMTDGNINISDIIEVIENTDPGSMPTMEMDNEYRNEQPHVKIIEQPAGKALRFRYECEGRSAGSLPGVNTTPNNKTYPSIQIVGYRGRAMVIVSCVTKDTPYRPHPHNLVGKESCNQGICTIEVPAGNMIVNFPNLGIQCIKKKDIEEALKIRKQLQIDPFHTGFDHRKNPTSIDLNTVRLCFQVFIEGSQKGKFNKPLPPVVSEPIYDKKAMSDLVICKLSHCSASVAGGMEMILLCEKVAKDDIQVRFFEEKDGQQIWEGYGDFQPTDVHKQTAIAFRTPAYHTQHVKEPVQVYIHLTKRSDKFASSEPLPFLMLPRSTDEVDSTGYPIRPKRPRLNNNAIVFKHRTENEKRDKHEHIPLNIKNGPSAPVLSFGAVSADTGGFTLQPVMAPYNNMQSLRPQISPRRTPSPLEYNAYSPPNMQQQLSPQYQPNINQPNISLMLPQQPTISTQPFSYEPSQSQIHEVEANLFMLNRATLVKEDMKNIIKNQGAGIQPLNNNAGSAQSLDVAKLLVDMDTHKLNIDWNPDDLANFTLSEELSSGLSLIDDTQLTANNNEESMTDSMTDRITWIKQELSSLNKILRSTGEDNGGGLG